MLPELVIAADRDHRGGVERLALTLLTVGTDQSVRVLEALAATLVNRVRAPRPGLHLATTGPTAGPPDAAAMVASDRKLGLCRRIARRALLGSLTDPTRGATAFHRLEGNPAWARDLLPVATFGSFLFYQLPAQE